MANEDQRYLHMHMVKKTLENDDSMGCFSGYCFFYGPDHEVWDGMFFIQIHWPAPHSLHKWHDTLQNTIFIVLYMISFPH